MTAGSTAKSFTCDLDMLVTRGQREARGRAAAAARDCLELPLGSKLGVV